MKIAVLIPCLNEELTIGKVVRDFKELLPEAIVYVYDNNSDDQTVVIAQKAGAEVSLEYRRGKANVVLRMFSDISADFYVLVDGDDTYPAEHVVELINVAQGFNSDMVIGDRISNNSYAKQNKRKFHSFGNDLMKKLINIFFRTNLNDILSGYRVFSRRFVKNYASLAKGFELETDLSIFSLHYELAIKEVPVNYRDRPEGSTSKLNTFKDGFKVIITFFNLYRFYKPLSFFTIIASFFLLGGLFLGVFPVIEYLKFNYVHKVPTAILSVSLVVISLLLFSCGLILDTLIKIDKKNTKLKFRNG